MSVKGTLSLINNIIFYQYSDPPILRFFPPFCFEDQCFVPHIQRSSVEKQCSFTSPRPVILKQEGYVQENPQWELYLDVARSFISLLTAL